VSCRVSGFYEFSRPIFVVRDPQLIKKMAVKDFDFFTDHRVVVTEETDVLFGKSLISLSGQKWKGKKALLSKNHFNDH
jgi:cytochrome P450 family 9